MSFATNFNKTPRPCQICGKKYVPKCPMQKYCPEHSKFMTKERSRLQRLKDKARRESVKKKIAS